MEKIGNHRLDPLYTRFDRRNFYVTYDITSQIQKGKMRLVCCWAMDGIIISQWPCGTFIVHLGVTVLLSVWMCGLLMRDGSVEVVSTGQDWKTSSGALIFNSIYTAEHYDARLEQKGWNTVNFDDSKWNGVGYRAVLFLHRMWCHNKCSRFVQ